MASVVVVIVVTVIITIQNFVKQATYHCAGYNGASVNVPVMGSAVMIPVVLVMTTMVSVAALVTTVAGMGIARLVVPGVTPLQTTMTTLVVPVRFAVALVAMSISLYMLNTGLFLLS